MKYILKKLFSLIITLLIVSFLAFLAFSVIPGDPTTHLLGTEATPQAIASLREKLGLDGPVIWRYLKWLGAFLQGDLGTSYTYSVSVGSMLSDKLPLTGLLTLLSFVITVLLSLPLGIAAGSVQSKAADFLITLIDQIIMSIPAFFGGVIICFLFGTLLRFFVPGSYISYRENLTACLSYLVFPALAIAIPRIAMTVKMLRGSIRSELGQDYVRTSQSRGNHRLVTLRRHVLRNAMIPVITFLAASMAEIVTSSIIIEQVFTVPGVGRLLLSSIQSRDFPVVQAIVVVLAAWIVTVNCLADIVNQLADPRIRIS